MELEQQVEDLIELIRQYMPSAGAPPFTVIHLKRSEIKHIHSVGAHSSQQLLFLIRTDFDKNDLIDFVFHAEEIIPTSNQQIFLNKYSKMTRNNVELLRWKEQITNVGVEMAIRLSGALDLGIEHIDANLVEIDNFFSFGTRNLQAFSLFDIYSCKP